MPQRRPQILEPSKPLPTPLRRSRRILELQHTQNPTPNNTQVHPISEISPIPCSSSSRTRSSSTKGKTSGCLNSGKSANGSSRKSRLNSKFEEVRRSTRLCNKISSLHYECSPPRTRGLKQVISNGSPITPLGMGENRLKCSDLSGYTLSGSKNDNRFVGCSPKIVVCGLACASAYVSVCSIPGVRKASQRKLGANNDKESACKLGANNDKESACELAERSFEKRVTRSALKRMKEPDDLSRENVGERVASTLAVNNILCVLEADIDKDAAFEKRVTRSVSRRMKERDDLGGKSVGKRVASKLAMKWKQGGIESSKAVTVQPEKRVTRSSVASASIRLEEEKRSSRSLVGIEKEHREMKKECLDAREKGLEVAETEKQAVCRDTKLTKLAGNKRKREEAGVKKGSDQGWTKEQEIALKRAYFAAKPSPRFWKKVAKLVPGKSAQECFNKVHSDDLTPLSNHQRSRAKKPNSPSDLSLSGCNLFKSPVAKSKKTGRKQKSHVARRAVRHLLQKHSKVNQDNGGDLFSVLEPTVDVLQLKTLQSTPEHLSGTPGSSSFKGSSGHKKARSRFFSSASKSPLTSPPVLKKVKNMALHEKYIDQLHKREAKRKAQFRRCVNGGEKEKNCLVVTKDVIRAAKNALVCDAMDAIKKFRHSQANIMNEFSESEEEVLGNEDEDDDIET